MSRARRNESFLAVELNPNRSALDVVGQSDRYPFGLQSTFRAEAATLIGIDVANLFGRQSQSLGGLGADAERSIIRHPNGQLSGLVHHCMCGMGFHGGVLNRGNPIALLENDVRFAKALLHVSGAKLEVFADIG